MSDLIRGLIALAESGYHDPVNIGNPDEFTLLELAETVKEVTGSSSEIVFEALPVDDPKQRQPDITLARELLGWSPEVSLREGLRAHDRAVRRRGAGRLSAAEIAIADRYICDRLERYIASPRSCESDMVTSRASAPPTPQTPALDAGALAVVQARRGRLPRTHDR